MHKTSHEGAHGRRSTLRWFRWGKSRGPLSGFLVTWDVDSRDRAVCRRLQRFVYGSSVGANGRTYRYPGVVDREGVRYLGQSVLLVRSEVLPVIVKGLTELGVEFEIDQASVG